MNQESIFLQGKDSSMMVLTGTATELLPLLGDEFKLLDPTTAEGAGEKHLPHVTVSENKIDVQVGSVEHPMTEEHSIQWIFLKTRKGGQLAMLKPADAPRASFLLAPGDEALCVYSYCNLHGFWKSALK